MLVIRQLNKKLQNVLLYNFALAKGQIPRRFKNRQKKRLPLLSLEQKLIQYNPVQALSLVRLHQFTTFEQSVEVCIRLNVNPKNGQQVVRGTATLPAGLGKNIKTAVFCSKDQWEIISKQVQVDFHLKQEDLKKLQKGPIQFQRLFTTPAHIQKLKNYGKMLGPKGLMPNAKLGTLVSFQQLSGQLKKAKMGQVTYRVDNGRNIHAQIGKVKFTDEQLLTNWEAIMRSLVDRRPSSLKGKYFTQAYVKSTMGPSWKISLLDIDPRSDKSLWNYLAPPSE